MKDGAAPQPAEGGFFVTMITVSGSTTKRVDGDVLTVGRAEDSNLTIAHDTLSRRHLSFYVQNGQMFVEDHASSNGTFVNGKRIKAHTRVRLIPEDFVTMGQAAVKLSVSTEPVMRKEGVPPLPAKDAQPKDTIVTSTNAKRQSSRVNIPVPPPKGRDEAAEEAERLVQEAQKKAALLIQESEIEAERRVEDIYRRAHETQSKMDEIYQKRMNEAFRASEEIYQKAQAESHKILDAARDRSKEIREQAENFVMELRRRTEQECERLLEEAQITARDLKENRLLEAEDIIKKRQEDFVRQAQEEMNTRLARFEEDLLAESKKHRAQLEEEFNDRKMAWDHEQKDTAEKLAKQKKDIARLEEQRQNQESDLAEARREFEVTQQQVSDLQRELLDARDSVQAFNHNLANIRSEIERASKEKAAVEQEAKGAFENLAHLKEELRKSNEDLKEVQRRYESQVIEHREKLDELKMKIEQEEKSHLEDLKLQTTRKVRDLELKLLEEVEVKRDRMAREIALLADTHLKEKGSSRDLQEKVSQLLKSEIVTISKDEAAKTKQATMAALKRQQRVSAMMWGLVIGGMIGALGPRLYKRLNSQLSPMQQRVIAAQEERKQDLELRKFAPPLTKDFKESYVDNVVYTENFVPTYSSDDFQTQFMKALTPYMLRTWKIEEDKVIGLLGISGALVKALHEKRQNIHPDFVNQSLEKMRETENEAIQRMRDLLGTQVRYESFKKFEKRFYETYQPTISP